jgi:hypothetical protein
MKPGIAQPSVFQQDVFIPEDVKCDFTATNNTDQTIVMSGTARFNTDAFIENYFIDKASLTSRLQTYAADNSRTLDNQEEVALAVQSIPEYSGIPTRVVSFSDQGPGLLVMATSSFPLIGIDDQSTVNLKVAIENKLPTSVPKKPDLNGRIRQINSLEILIPNGLQKASSGCEDWQQQGNKLILADAKRNSLNNELKNVKKSNQLKIAECMLIMADKDLLLSKLDRPNPAEFVGSVDYDYEVQKRFNVRFAK